MIAWLQPLGFIGLAAVALPVVIHLLRRQRARRMVIPTVRFVRSAKESSVRLSPPSDPWLLLVRVGIIASAAAALAHPLVVTEWRRDAWAARTARVIVVDTTAGPSPEAVDELVRAESQLADYPLVIRSAELPGAIRRGAAWLTQSPPARREIVVVSHFARGSLWASDVTPVPQAIGLRFVRTAARVRDASQPAAGLVLAEGGMRRQTIQLHGATTIVEEGPAAQPIEGVRIETRDGDREVPARLLRIVSRAGTPAPTASRPIVVRFGQDARDGDGAWSPWMVGVGQRLLATANSPLTITALRGELMVHADVEPDTFDGAAVVAAALDALRDPRSPLELEIEGITQQTLDAWSRPSLPPDVDAWRRSDDWDGRWLWGVALVLLVVESRLRQTPRGTGVERARAA